MTAYEPFVESRFETKHEITVRGKRIPFSVIAEDFVIRDAAGEAEASIFSYSYLQCQEGKGPDRPVLFVWDGGPGCSAGTENLRSFGPWRLKTDPATGEVPVNPPYELEENPNCLLDVCDLVMIDPVGTGFAQNFNPDNNKYYSVDGDAKAAALFIETWLNENHRWNSPRYLLGTSYGTIRCVRTVEEMNGGPFHKNGVHRSIPVNGVILTGAALAINETATSMTPEGIEPTLLLMRSMVATNEYHKGNKAPKALCDEAEAWAFSELADFYANGGDEEKRAALAAKMSEYTGLPAEVLLSFELKLPAAEVFTAMVLAGRGLDAGVYDARMTLPKNGNIGMADPAADDPGMGVYTPALIGGMNGPLKEKLGIAFKRRFVYQDYGINGRWSWAFPEAVVPELPARNHVQCLTAAMRRNQKMQVLFANGLYDLCAWSGTNKYTAENSELPAERTQFKEYPGGHMCYTDPEAAAQMAADIRDLIAKSK